MQKKHLAGLNCEFYSSHTRSKLEVDFPAFSKLLQDPELLFKTLEAISKERLSYLNKAQNIGSYEPLEYSKHHQVGLVLSPTEYITPISHSFRRQIIFSTQHDHAIEILIPGQPSLEDRALITRARLDHYKTISNDPAATYYFQPVLGFIHCSQTITLQLYNEEITFDQEHPLGMIIYDYSPHWRGKRIGNNDIFDHQGNMSLDYFTRVAPKYSASTIINKMHEDIQTITNIMHCNLLAGSKKTATGGTTELHLENFLLNLNGNTICVMDASNWLKTKTPEEATDLDEFPLHHIYFNLDRMLKKLG